MHGLILGTSPLGAIVSDYNNTLKKSAIITLGAYKTYLPQTDAIVRGLHLVGNRIHLGNQHQNHIRKAKKESAASVLSPTALPQKIKDFEDLFNWTYSLLKKNGIIKQPCLWVYDIALRLGQAMTPVIEPRKYVYLYAGAKQGAIMLGGIRIKDNKARTTTFPSLLRNEGSLHIENIMCNYSK